MPQRPWAIDDLIIYDEDNLRSQLHGGWGLPAAGVEFSRRYGRWPAIGGLSRPGVRLTLETYFKHATAAERKAARIDLLQHLNPELEEMRRLTVVDEVIQGVGRDGVLLALGPWDVYCDDDGAWHVRDLLRPDTIEGDLAGGWWTGPGEGMRIAEATTNLCTNPSAETNTTNWALSAGASLDRINTDSIVGSYCFRFLADSQYDHARHVISVSPSTAYTFSAWVKATSSDVKITIYDVDDATTIGTTAHSGSGEWEYLTVTATTGAGTSSIQIRIMEQRASGFDYVYFDACQCEERAYATPYCDGSLGDSHTWSGTAHGSTSSRTSAGCDLDDHVDLISDNTTVSFHLRFVAEYDADTDWPDEAILFDARGGSDSDRIYIAFEDSADKFHVYVNGADRFQSSAQTFDRGDEVDLILTLDFDDDSYALYVDGAVGGSDMTSLAAPTLTAWCLGSDYAGANQANCTHLVYQVFDRIVSADEVALMATQNLNARWLDVLCEAALPWAPSGTTTDRGIVATLAVDKDVRWRQRDGDVHFWRVYDDTGETTVDVESDDDVYPVFRLTPRTAKTGDYAYRRWVPVIWTVDAAYTNYPYMIGTFDTAALVSASKAQSDGDDWRILVDGVEVDRWFGDSGTAQFNQTATKTWVNLSFQAGQQATLEAAIGSGDTVDSIDVNEDISGFPSSGILLLDNGSNTEAFTYTGKNDAERRFTGVTRSAKGTTARAFSASDDVYWIQHDIWIWYGSASATAPTQDDDYKPVFDLGDSTNTSWVYEEFGEDDGLRTGAWADDGGDAIFYTANHYTNADPWEEIGIYVYPAQDGPGRYYLYNPCGITNANFQNGEHRWGTSGTYYARIQSSQDGSSWTTEYTFTLTGSSGTWNGGLSRSEAITSDRQYVALMAEFTSGTSGYLQVEFADVTLTLDSSNTPTHEIGDELGNYNLACTIENETTEDSIEIAMTMALDETLEVDTYNKTIRLLADGTSQMQALTLVGGARRDWLRLVDGENDLSFSDTGTEELEIDILWDRRLFE